MKTTRRWVLGAAVLVGLAPAGVRADDAQKRAAKSALGAAKK